jgi:exoribonuclease R
MPYAHCTAPLRRLADRYVLDLVADLAAHQQPSAEDRARLPEVAKTMNEMETRGARLERAVVDIGEAWTLCSRVGETFRATVLAVQGGTVEVQIEDPPVRGDASRGDHSKWLELGEPVQVRLASADVEAGKIHFELV